MTSRRFRRSIGWAYLLIVPVALTAWDVWSMARSVCPIEIGAALGTNAAQFCGRFVYPAGLIAPPGGSTSAVELAALEVSFSSSMMTLLFALVALLVGYKAFFDEDAGHDRPHGLVFGLSTCRSTGDIALQVGNLGDRTVSLGEVETADQTGVRLHVEPARRLRGGKTATWTLFASGTILPSAIRIRADARVDRGVTVRYEVTFDPSDSSGRPVRLEASSVP